MSSQSLIVSQGKLSNNSYHAGVNGEQLAAAMLRKAGYQVEHVAKEEHAGDLRVIDQATGEVWRVEVKTARRSGHGFWQFLLNKRDKHGVTSCAQSDVTLLLAVLKSGAAVPFVIPCEALAGIQKISVPSHPEDYSGRWAAYRQRGPLRLGATSPC